jgi:hypothetical protein
MHITESKTFLKNLTRITNFPKNFKQYNLIEQKEYINEKLKEINLHSTIKRLNYNTWIFYDIYNFNIKITKKKKKYFLEISKIPIPIRVQDYFYVKFMKLWMEKEDIKNNWLNDDNYIDDDKILIEKLIKTHEGNKNYRIDYLINISNNNYIAIEFFENYHNNKDDIDYKKEKNRIHSIINDNDSDIINILCFGIFKEENLDNTEKLQEFVDEVYKRYIEYQYIDDERQYCIDGINKYINNKIFSESIYDAKESNKCVISFDTINEVINWKNEKYKNKHSTEFINKINKLTTNIDKDISDLNINLDEDKEIKPDIKLNVTDFYEDNKLSLKGLNRYLKINEEYLIDIFEEEKLLEINTQIMIGMVDGLKNQRNTILNMNNNRIFGLDD